MVKMALFCPRLPRESEGAWQLRYQACRLYLRQMHNVDVLEFETLEHLQRHYRRHAFRRVLVAQSGYYTEEFWNWAKQQRIDILDVLMRPDAEALREEASTTLERVQRRERFVPLVRQEGTRRPRYELRHL
jgi:hypothetical protein